MAEKNRETGFARLRNVAPGGSDLLRTIASLGGHRVSWGVPFWKQGPREAALVT